MVAIIRARAVLHTPAGRKKPSAMLSRAGNCKILGAWCAIAQSAMANGGTLPQWGSTPGAWVWRAALTAYDGGLTTPTFPKGPPMKIRLNLDHLQSARAEDQRRAVMLEFPQYKGQHDVTLEIDLEGARKMLTILYEFARTAGEFAPPQQSLPDVPLSSVLLLPTEEIETRATEAGGLWVLLRTGVLDTAVALPDPRAAQLLAHSLLAAMPK